MERVEKLQKGFMRLIIFLSLFLYLPVYSYAQASEDVAPLQSIQGIIDASGMLSNTTGTLPLPVTMPAPAHMKGTIKGTGTHFELHDSEYLNVILESSETVTVRLESFPEIIIMFFEQSPSVNTSEITITNLIPSTTYYKYDDNYHNLTVIASDEDGKLKFTQDLMNPHRVYIQTKKSTKFLKNNATGGDCASIGVWNGSSKTCLLTGNVNESIQFDDDYLTLDGNGYTLTGTGTGYGIYSLRTGGTIKNLKVKGFGIGVMIEGNYNIVAYNTVTNNYYGIYIGAYNTSVSNNTTSNNTSSGIVTYIAGNNIFTNNIASNNGQYGIIIGGGRYSNSGNNVFKNNITSNNRIGILLRETENNTLSDNITQENIQLDLFVDDNSYDKISSCNNKVERLTGSGGRPIRFVNSAEVITGQNLSQLILCNATNAYVDNVTVRGSAAYSNNGIYILRTNNAVLSNSTSTNNYHAIMLKESHYNTLSGNRTENNAWDIVTSFNLSDSSHNTLVNNEVSSKRTAGISIDGGGNNTLSGNKISNAAASGIYVRLSPNNILKNNIVSNNTYGIAVQNSDATTLENNIVSNNGSVGIYLSNSINNVLTNNIAQDNGGYDLYVAAWPETYCNNSIQDTMGSGGRPIIFLNSAAHVENEVLSQLILCNADNARITNVTVKGSGNRKNNGINMTWSDNVTIEKTTSSDNYYGLELSNFSNNNTVADGDFSNNYYGIQFSYASNNIIKNNTIENNETGLGIGGEWNNQGSYNNRIYNNNFVANRTQIIVRANQGNVFSMEKPTGGNYWSNFDTADEGCYDLDGDRFCDSPFYIGWFGYDVTGTDYFPWSRRDGWNQPSDSTPPATIIALSGTHGDNDWLISEVNIILMATDNNGGSGVKEIHYSIDGVETVVAGSTASFTISADGEHSVSYYAVDNAVNTETAHPLSIKIDQTAPTVTALPNPAPNAAGWNNTNVTVTFTCSDAISGIESCQAPIEVVSEGAGQVISGQAKDFAGLTATTSATVNIDRTVPVITASVSPSPNSAGWHNTDVTVTFACSDALSGIASCPAPITVTTEGAGQVITGTAVDKAGNTATAAVTLNIDKTPPSIPSLSTSPGMLWPPNHKLVDVLINGSAADYGSDIASIVISVTDEYGVYNMTGLSFGGTIQLEAWREGTDGDGRQYTITAVVTDKAGNRSTATTVVLVPHDMR